jgi:hypothetical protein
VVGIGRSTTRYWPASRADEPASRGRLRELALERRRFGYRRLHVLLAREGVAVNHKRVERLYRDEGLTVRRRARKRVAMAERTPLLLPTFPNEQWSLDVVGDALSWGRRSRLLAVVDTVTREALAIEVDTSLPGERVARVLARIAGERGGPRAIVLDNGPELTGRALDQWAYARGVHLRSSRPAGRCRTPSPRASSGACATSASTSTGSPAWPTRDGPSRRGARTTTQSDPTAASATGHRPRPNGPGPARRLHCRSRPDSHHDWTDGRGQVNVANGMGGTRAVG